MALRAEVEGWLPQQFAADDRARLLEELVPKTLQPIDEAIAFETPTGPAAGPPAGTEDAAAAPSPSTAAAGDPADASTALEAQDELGEEQPGRNPAARRG